MDILHQLADEVRETFGDRGHKITDAIQSDPAFQVGRGSQSRLGRDLVLEAVKAGCSHLGLELRTSRGGAVDIVVLDEAGIYRYHRVKKANVNPETDCYEMIGDEAMLAIEDRAVESLFAAQQWVFGYTVDDDGLVLDIFAARVLGVTNESVSKLRLGTPIMLGVFGTNGPATAGFFPDDEDDLGMNDDGTEENGAADAG